jgi:hypothetical protein
MKATVGAGSGAAKYENPCAPMPLIHMIIPATDRTATLGQGLDA